MYEKHFTNPERTTYRIVQVYPDGRRRTVSELQDLYQEYLAKGGEVVEVPYTPPPPDTRPADIKRADLLLGRFSVSELIEAIWQKLADGDAKKFDAIQAAREDIKIIVPVADATEGGTIKG